MLILFYLGTVKQTNFFIFAYFYLFFDLNPPDNTVRVN